MNPPHEFFGDLLESRVRLYATRIFDNLQGIINSEGACDVRFARAADGWAVLAELLPGRRGGGDVRRGGDKM